MTTMTESKRRFFDGIAAQWDSFGGPPEAASQQERFVRLATEHHPSRILDVGCGTGLLVPIVRKQVPAATLVELDFSSQMLAVNRAKHGDHVEYCCTDLSVAPFADGGFDCILCFNALPHMDIDTALAKCRDLLCFRGRLAIGHLQGSAELNAFHSSVNGPVSHDLLPPSAELSERLHQVGLQVVLCQERTDWYFILAEKTSESYL